MGQSLACAARVDGRADRGTAQLETDFVIFRGEASRARVPFASVRTLVAKGGWLAIGHAAGALELELGERAVAWEARIRTPKGLVEKLGVGEGARVALVGMEGDALAEELERAGATVRAGAPRGEVDVVFLRVKAERELARVEVLAKKIALDGALWIVRPKGKDGVAEGAVFAAGRGAGLVDVKVTRWSDAETGMKFVVPKAKRAR
jgi:hypothetical protein